MSSRKLLELFIFPARLLHGTVSVRAYFHTTVEHVHISFMYIPVVTRIPAGGTSLFH